MPEDPRNSWGTPQELFDRISDEFGPFNIDVAASSDNAKCPFYLSDTGLTSVWAEQAAGRVFAWCNPPFGDIEPWVKKAWEETLLGVTTAMLLPANRTEQPWFHRWVIGKADEILFLRGRVNYVAPVGIEPSTCGFASMVVVFAPGKPDWDRGANTITRSL